MITLYIMAWTSTESVMLSLAAINMLLFFLRLMFYAAMTDSMGSLLRLVIEIMKSMRHFFLLLLFLFGGFLLSFKLLLHPEESFQDTAVQAFTILMGDFQDKVRRAGERWQWQLVAGCLTGHD